MLIERLFAKRDYEGLTEGQKIRLKHKRNQAAKDLRGLRKEAIDLVKKDLEEYPEQVEGRVRHRGTVIGYDKPGIGTAKGMKRGSELGLRMSYGLEESSRVWRNPGESFKDYQARREKQALEDIANSAKELEIGNNLRRQVIEDVDKINPRYENLAKLKKTGKVALGVAGVGATTYAGVKAYKHHKNKDKE